MIEAAPQLYRRFGFDMWPEICVALRKFHNNSLPEMEINTIQHTNSHYTSSPYSWL